jgi:hypothetical protein
VDVGAFVAGQRGQQTFAQGAEKPFDRGLGPSRRMRLMPLMRDELCV